MRIWSDLSPDSKNFQGGALTIGNFDGLHLGHQALLAALKGEPGPRTVLTFEPHPVKVLYPEKRLKRLFPVEDLSEQLSALGLDLLVRIPFTLELAKQPAKLFLDTVVKDRFRARVLVAGYDFALGRKREGDLPALTEWGSQAGVRIVTVPPVTMSGGPVSSRRLRELVEAGSVKEAARMLGRPFYVRGEVVRGAGRGRPLGFPTLNLRVENETWPAPGVYATFTRIGKDRFSSVTNVGTAPTFSAQGKLGIETHVLDADVEAYGRRVDIDFVTRIREEKRFSSAEDLKKQIDRDILEARRELKNETLDGDRF